MKLDSLQLDPYQVLFPLGVLHAIWGAWLWVGFAFGSTPYPGVAHAQIMVGGFLLSFALGFLLTAIPKFTGSPPCSRKELGMAAGFSIATFYYPRGLVSLGALLFLAIFVARRFRQRQYVPPPYFVLLPGGFLLGISGAAILALVDSGALSGEWVPAGRLFLDYGMMLLFLLGIGAKLIAALLGWAEPPLVQLQSAKVRRPERSREYYVPTIIGIILIGGFLLEARGNLTVGRLLRAVGATWIATTQWRLPRPPRRRARHAWWLWISAGALVVSLWVHALVPEYGVQAAHLTFIGGLGLITLLVAARVTLAHGNFDLAIETRSRIFGVVATLALLAALTRFSAPWTPSYALHLGYAALVWIAAVVVWGLFFIPKMIRRQGTES